MQQVSRVASALYGYAGKVRLLQTEMVSLVEESGEGPAGAFYNAWQVTKRGEGLFFAKKRPLSTEFEELFPLISLKQGSLQNASFYHCHPDKYALAILLEDTGFQMHWQVEGLQEKDSFIYEYS
ncbi:MAG: DUF6314 family protein [Chlamydiota bacterium]